VFLRAQNKIQQWQDAGGSIGTWMYRATLRVVQERRRAARLRRWLLRTTTETQSFVDEPELPARQLQRKQASSLVYRVLEALPERQRAALIMFEIEGMSGEQIASVFNRPVANVWVWLHRARARFLTELQSLGLDKEALGFASRNTEDVRRKSAS
jgi:RNA polymerase sigma-70 factor, ECF subfamily